MRPCHRTSATAVRLIVLVSVALIASAASAQTTELSTKYSWTAPTTGSPVDHYIVQQSVGGGTWTQVASVTAATVTLNLTTGLSYQIRVAGVDALARQGTWSVASDAYIPDAGVPGAPGKPVVTP